MKKYYYALFDNQLDTIIATAFNNQSKELVRKNLVNYMLLGNFSKEGEESIKNNSLPELLNYYEFTLLKSEFPFDDKKEYQIDNYSINFNF